MHTVRSAARALGIAKSTVYRAVKDGRLPAHRLTNGKYAIYPGELRRAFPPDMAFETNVDELAGFKFPTWDVS
jgi:excisionase family DNA binding protein